MNYFINPKRSQSANISERIKFFFSNIGCYLGFQNINYSHVNGDPKRILIGNGCSTMNTIFNTVSGKIYIGDDTIFGHNCMILTGRHRFYKGKRAKLIPNSEHFRETPEEGYDITIGKGCFIGSGAIIIGPVKIGDNVIIGAGAIVNKDVEKGVFSAGNPSKTISKHPLD